MPDKQTIPARISLIVAAAANNVMGKNNQLPWHLPADLQYFKSITWGMPIVMGRKTFESIGKPLPGRKNIVISRQPGLSCVGAETVTSMEAALQLAQEADVKEIFIIGGAELFLSMMPQAQRIYLTRIHEHIEGDVFFPALDESEWQQVSNRDFTADEKNKYAYSFQVWERIL
jgi:dihydrofolate reductase